MLDRSFSTATAKYRDQDPQSVERALLEVCPSLLILSPIRDSQGELSDLVCTYMSESAADLLGLKTGQAEQSTAAELFPDYQSQLLPLYIKVLEEGIPSTEAMVLNRHVASDPQGSESILLHASKLNESLLIYLEGYHEGTRSAAGKRGRAAMLEEVLSRSAELVALTGVDGNLTFVNEAFALAFGKPAASFTGQALGDLLEQGSGTTWAGHVLRSLETGDSQGDILKLESGEGLRTYWVSSFPVRDSLGHVVGAGTVANDITEILELQAEVEQKASLLDLSNDAILAHGLDGVVSYWNQGLSGFTGGPLKKPLGLLYRT